jgi:biopolymer transport protein ExbB
MSFRRTAAALVIGLSVLCLQAQWASAQTAQPAAAPTAAAPAPAPETPLQVSAETPVQIATDTAVQTSAAAGAVAPDGHRKLSIGQAFMKKMVEGGWTMIFILFASIAGVGYAIERLVNLRVGAIAPKGLAERADALWREERFDELEALAAGGKSAMARVLTVIVQHRHSSMADVSAMAGDVASRELRRHLQKAYPLAVVATISPLLGLFGTVIGMIGAFDKVAAAGALGDASLLGGDISKALITTAAGLTVAMPSLVLYHYFKNRTSLLAITLEEEVGELLSSWFSVRADAPAGVKESGNAR